MSSAKKIGIAVSDHSVRLYLSAQTVQHLGGPGTKVRFLSKKIEEGHWEISIREDKQASFKINPHGSSDHPFKIEMAAPPYPLDRWPKTPPVKPVYIPITYDVQQKRQISFSVRSDELSGKTDFKNPASALKTLANKIRDEPVLMGWEQTKKLDVQPPPQATPIRPIMAINTEVTQPKREEDVPANERAEREAYPPAHQRLQMLLQGLNAILTTELNDIELYVEQIDETGGVVKTITLPVPSQMRLKGRRIREETFG